MRRLLLLCLCFIMPFPLFAQPLSGKWLTYEGSDGSELTLSLMSDGTGRAELSLIRRSQAVSYGEGSQFWGTFRTTGGYYFLVKGSKKVNVKLTQKDSTLTVVQSGAPSVSVKAWLDEAYSARDLSDYGGYKKQVVSQWKRDFPNNEDVKKGKRVMEHYFDDFYGNVFEVLLFGEYRILERTNSTIKLKNLNLEIPIITWERIE